MKTNLSPLNSPSWSSLSKMGKMGKMGQRWEDIVGHKLPSITQEILGKYRSSQAKSISYKEELVMCEILWFSSPPSSEQCKCDKTNGRCSLVMKWISGCYLWKNDERFSRAYQSYNKLEMETFLEDSELKKRLSKKLLQLGIEADSSCKTFRTQVLRCYFV